MATSDVIPTTTNHSRLRDRDRVFVCWRGRLASRVEYDGMGTNSDVVPCTNSHRWLPTVDAVLCSILINGHSFERICTNFGMWHLYILLMFMGVSKHRSSLEPAGWTRIGRRNGSSAVGAKGGALVSFYNPTWKWYIVNVIIDFHAIDMAINV